MERGLVSVREELTALVDALGASVALAESRLRSTLDARVEQLHRIADLRHYIAEHPWPTFWLAVIAGYLAARR